MLDHYEKGGERTKSGRSFRKFQELVSDTMLIDVRFQGRPRFTWCNNRSGDG